MRYLTWLRTFCLSPEVLIKDETAVKEIWALAFFFFHLSGLANWDVDVDASLWIFKGI